MLTSPAVVLDSLAVFTKEFSSSLDDDVDIKQGLENFMQFKSLIKDLQESVLVYEAGEKGSKHKLLKATVESRPPGELLDSEHTSDGYSSR